MLKPFKMPGTRKKHVFHVKWKMFPHVPSTCSHVFPNTFFVALDVLDEQRVGEHVCYRVRNTRTRGSHVLLTFHSLPECGYH